MHSGQISYQMPVSTATLESSARVMGDLRAGSYKEQFLTNAARPFIEKQSTYLVAYERFLRSLNHRYIFECKGDVE